MDSGKGSRAERIVVPVCGVLFLLSGIYAGIWAGSDIVFRLRMRNAVQVRGRLLKVEETGDGVARGNSVQYRYEFGGKTYSGSRATIHGVADNFGDFQWELGERLGQAFDKGEDVIVYVNPARPEMSALDLTLRFSCIAFPLFYFAVATPMGLLLLRKANNARRSLSSLPGIPPRPKPI